MVLEVAGYHGLKSGELERTWIDKKADITDNHVYIDGHPVMESWEQPYMAALARKAASRGGKVLEVGFGLALSARAFQECDIQEHVIIEANADVFKKLVSWAAQQKHKVTPLFGLWQDVVHSLPSNDFDGIMYDTYPQNAEQQHVHQFGFLKHARRLLKPVGILTYCNLTSLGVLRAEYSDPTKTDEENWRLLFEATQKPHLLKDCGFKEEEIREFELHSLVPPKECAYYQHHTQLIPVLVKAN
uniref:Uncharacterized protein n=1 Tax=Chromera velia CCMP2878 TaxID=1169474 RepID=A0A0G4HX82_9ALVE|mmetsp:Transcript_29055/g.56914  ORF Transcript_29055/g.56914 Transcript_29055/m.56914 type:complete len:244 (+) Transcript_29055:106-837(+)|eukprot:Cvel_9216.t1-p1 / transcript=Cvel_9216.t1 / gene=Cvel_9216 / organism=Chromera_velia_CCMP2878 / gene_product=Guanidinoacetate N-methyltransferase B, putative / transcript_product=Guanidinoacetate N-methyltransferase B, putative / location=Cvel_scaffold525:51127-52433(+) / protein_length=243 / sequence_SO=supercontig / SO=protein_coding / is_pseudo=false